MGARPGIAVVGCGTIATYQHLPHLARLRSARLVAAADPDPAARARVARRFGIPALADAAELVARPEVDALVLASPTHCHAEHALLAIAAGKPFYLEKPLAASAEDGRRVVAASAARGVAGWLGFNYRLQPIHLAARALVADGALGELIAVRTLFGERLPDGPAAGWRARRESGGGVWLDLASHHVDLVRWLTGDEFVTVAAAEVASLRREHDRAAASFVLASGAVAHGLFLYGSGPVDRVELVGRSAILVADRLRGTLRLERPRRRGYGVRSRRAGSWSALAGLRLRRWVQPSWEPSFGRAMGAFARAVGGGARHAAPLATLADGAASLAVVLAAERAARDGRPCDVTPLGG